ncbi:MAG: hypothetical protein ACRDPK_17230 [Carbonactinosporaceae bacterium]
MAPANELPFGWVPGAPPAGSLPMREHRHTTGGFTLPAPEEWEVAENVSGCALVVSERAYGPFFTSNIVVTIEEMTGDESLDAWVDRSRDALRESLNRLRVIDVEEATVAGLPARRTLSHYLHQHHGGVNLEQWSLARGGYGYVISASCGALDYDEMHDVGRRVVDGLRFEGAEP